MSLEERDEMEILPPFIVDESRVEHGIDSITRVAIVDQTPNKNLLGFVLKEYSGRIVQLLNEDKFGDGSKAYVDPQS